MEVRPVVFALTLASATAVLTACGSLSLPSFPSFSQSRHPTLASEQEAETLDRLIERSPVAWESGPLNPDSPALESALRRRGLPIAENGEKVIWDGDTLYSPGRWDALAGANGDVTVAFLRHPDDLDLRATPLPRPGNAAAPQIPAVDTPPERPVLPSQEPTDGRSIPHPSLPSTGEKPPESYAASGKEQKGPAVRPGEWEGEEAESPAVEINPPPERPVQRIADTPACSYVLEPPSLRRAVAALLECEGTHRLLPPSPQDAQDFYLDRKLRLPPRNWRRPLADKYGLQFEEVSP